MTSNTNGHYNAASPSGALTHDHSIDNKKHMVTSPHKLMMGVPPAATPNSISSTNGTSASQNHQQTEAQPHSTTVNGSISSEAKGKQKEEDPIHNVPLSQLEEELPLEETDLISLAALVERLANYGYESLQNLAETLPSLPSSSKRAKIFNTALDVRKQFIKLLVLSRWSKNVPDLQKSRNIIALLSEQQWQHEDVFAGLTDIRKILPNARMRNADLPTAIDVLQTGTYRRLPASIKDMAVAPKPFTDEQALEIVSRLEDALRTRMACRELVPAPLSDYSIRDGKVHFHVIGLFQAQLTASSGGQDEEADAHVHFTLPVGDGASIAGGAASTTASTDDRWWLLDLNFDVTPTGSCAASCNQMFPRKPKRAYRERLRVWGDQELAPRSQGADVDETKKDQSEATAETKEPAADSDKIDEKPKSTEDSGAPDQPTESTREEKDAPKTSNERDVPLLRLFAFLQERSLHYQMDILQHQAFELCRLNWGSNLRIETGERPRRLTVHYWTQAQGGAGDARKRDSPATGGSITTTIVDLVDNAGATKTLAKILDDDDQDSVDGQTSLTTVKRRGLRVSWEAHSSILADSKSSDLIISPHSLDIESLLGLVIKRHTSALLRNLQKRILVGDHPVSRLLRPEDCTVCVEHSQRQGDEFSTATEANSVSFLQIELHGSSRQGSRKTKHANTGALPPLRLSVDPVTGRLSLDVESTRNSLHDNNQQSASFTASILTTRTSISGLAEASDRINDSIEALFDVLYKLEVFARVEDWERMASYLELRTVRKLNLRPHDLAKFGISESPEAAPQLFLPLRNSFPGYFLALQPSELAGASIALVYVVQMMDPTGAPSLAVQSIEWLDRAKIAGSSKTGDDAAFETGQKRKAGQVVGSKMTEMDPKFGERDLTMDELANVHSYCIALVSYFRVEQQLRMRGIPYLHVGSNTSRSAPPAKSRRSHKSIVHADVRDNGLFEEEGMDSTADASPKREGSDGLTEAQESGIAALVPTLCIRATDLLGPAKAHLTKPNVSLRVRNWDDNDQSCVQVLIKLRMKSRRFRALHEVVAYASTSDGHSTAPSTWVDFDDELSLLTVSTRDLDNCLPIFYMQWERVLRMVQLTREVLNASRAWQARALRSRVSCKKPKDLVELRKFDFDMVIFSYGAITVEGEERKLLMRVRWQDAKVEMTPFNNIPVTQSGGYILEFGSVPTSQADLQAATPQKEDFSKWFDDSSSSLNPHSAMAFELRRIVNLSARSAAMTSMTHPHFERMVWKGLFRLLRDTLALVTEIAPLTARCLDDPDVPEVEIKGATWWRLRFQDRFAVDLRLASRSRLVISDAARSLFRSEDGEQEVKEGIFGGSELLSCLIEGKQYNGDDAKGKKRKANDTTELASMQFQPIPNVQAVLSKVRADLGGDKEGRVWDLRRALLVSLSPQGEDKGEQGLLHRILPSTIQGVSDAIKGGETEGAQV